MKSFQQYQVSRTFGANEFRQSEIQNLRDALIGHHDVAWLDIAMDDACHGRQSVG